MASRAVSLHNGAITATTTTGTANLGPNRGVVLMVGVSAAATTGTLDIRFEHIINPNDAVDSGWTTLITFPQVVIVSSVVGPNARQSVVIMDTAGGVTEDYDATPAAGVLSMGGVGDRLRVVMTMASITTVTLSVSAAAII